MSNIDSLEELYELLLLDRKYSNYSREQTLKGRLEEVQKELTESLQEMAEGDSIKLRDEMGDVLLDILACFIITEEKKLFTISESARCAIEKIQRRKPFLIEEKAVTKEEEISLWKTAKAQERD